MKHLFLDPFRQVHRAGEAVRRGESTGPETGKVTKD